MNPILINRESLPEPRRLAGRGARQMPGHRWVYARLRRQRAVPGASSLLKNFAIVIPGRAHQRVYALMAASRNDRGGFYSNLPEYFPSCVRHSLHVMPGLSRPKDGVASLAYDPGIHETVRRRQSYE